MKKRLLSIIAAFAVMLSFSACQAGNTGDKTQTSEVMANSIETSETSTAEVISESVPISSQTKENNQAYTADNENTNEYNNETVVIAGQEFPINIKHVEIKLTNDSPLVTDISEIGKLTNLEYLSINNVSDGGPYAIDGLEAIKDCTAITGICIRADLADEEDICILETLPNLKDLTIYGIEAYEDWNFELQNLKHLRVVGTFDILRIKHLTSLESLDMEYNYCEDLSPITNFPNLKSLTITECGFTNYSDLLDLNCLTELFISSTPMTEEMYNKIAEKFPECKITIVNDFIE